MMADGRKQEMLMMLLLLQGKLLLVVMMRGQRKCMRVEVRMRGEVVGRRRRQPVAVGMGR